MLRTLLFFSIIYAIAGQSQNVAPIVSASGESYYCPLTSQSIVTFFDITDPDDNSTDAFYIQISEGFDQNYDLLELNGTHPNISATWNASEAKLTLTSANTNPLNYSDIIAAVYDVSFYSSDPNISQNRVFSLTVGQANYLALTDHYYEFIPSVAILWTDAKILAEI